jgi:hypothetical protein
MKTIIRIAAFAVFAFTVHAAHTAWLTRIQPGISAAQAMRQFNGTEAGSRALRWFEAEKNIASAAAAGAVLVAAMLCFAPSVRRPWTRRPFLRLLAAGSTLMLGGCAKSYSTPEFVPIDTAQTRCFIPLESDTRNRAKFEPQATPLALQCKQIEVEKVRVEKWGGPYPQDFLAPPSTVAMLMHFPPSK